MRWLADAGSHRTARVCLYCFPYAGGGGWVFRGWQPALADIEVCAIELPGRGVRMAEPPLTDLESMVGGIAESINRYSDRPFAFFGHSMGALIAFEVSRELRRESWREPLHLFVSGREAPHVASKDPPYHRLPDTELVGVLRDLDGTPREVLEEPALMQVVLPRLRADFQLLETYAYRDETPLRCAITALGGTGDATVRRENLESWRAQTTGRFTLRMIEGDHFFLHEAPSVMLSCLREELWQHRD